MPLAEYNDVTRMTRAQLAERIRQMEATAHRNSSIGSPNERHRPMEDRRRWEKISLYRAELERRERMDECDRATQAAADARATKQSAHDAPQQHCSYTLPSGHQCGALAIADLATRPACARHGAEAAAARYVAEAAARYVAATEDPPCDCHVHGDQADASDCDAHGTHRPAPIGEQPTPDAGQEPDTMTYNAAIELSMRQQASEWNSRDAELRQERQPAADRAAEVAYQPASDPPASSNANAPVIPVPELTLPCPQCHAAPGARCSNYTGHPCAPHHQRIAAARPAPTPEASHPDPAAAHSPAARAAKRAIKEAARKAAATVEASRGATAAELAEARAMVADLVRRHTSGTIIEMAWDAAHEQFHPAPRQ